MNAECIRIASTTVPPEALNAVAIMVARPINMSMKTKGEALLHGTRKSGRCQTAHMIPT